MNYKKKENKRNSKRNNNIKKEEARKCAVKLDVEKKMQRRNKKGRQIKTLNENINDINV